MTLTDAGVLYALVDANQNAHARCVATLLALPKPLLTHWSCFTEAMYFAYKSGGWRMQHQLWGLVEEGLLKFHSSTEAEIERMRELMAKYSDTPMDVADASLVATAEALGLKLIFTLDSDFYVYRLNDTESFEVAP